MDLRPVDEWVPAIGAQPPLVSKVIRPHGPAFHIGCGSALASPAFSGPPRGRPASVRGRCLTATDHAVTQPAYREWGLRPRARATLNARTPA